MEVKFKNGDSVKIPEGCKAVVKDNVVIFEPIEQEFKRGDFLTSQNGAVILIFSESKGDTFDSLFENDAIYLGSGWITENFRLATPEQKAELIEFMHAYGKDWDEEKCEVVDYRWRAEKGEKYYIVAYSGVSPVSDMDYSIDNKFFKEGNYFKTKELAEIALEKRNELFLTLKHS